jgi:hypothetical protein
MDVITVSGADMVGGCKPGGLAAAAEEEGNRRGGGGGDLDMKIDNVDREPLAIIAMVFVVASFGLALVRTRQALIGVFVLSIGALGALAGLYIKVKGEIGDLVDKEFQSKTGGESMGSAMMKDTKIDAGGRMGLWGAAAGLLVVAFLSGRALKDRGDDVPSAPAPPPTAG